MCWSKTGLPVARRVANTLRMQSVRLIVAEHTQNQFERTFHPLPSIADVRKVEHLNNAQGGKGSRSCSGCRNSSFHLLPEDHSFRVAGGFGWNVCAEAMENPNRVRGSHHPTEEEGPTYCDAVQCERISFHINACYTMYFPSSLRILLIQPFLLRFPNGQSNMVSRANIPPCDSILGLDEGLFREDSWRVSVQRENNSRQMQCRMP